MRIAEAPVVAFGRLDRDDLERREPRLEETFAYATALPPPP
jgi:hypothetical protein